MTQHQDKIESTKKSNERTVHNPSASSQVKKKGGSCDVLSSVQTVSTLAESPQIQEQQTLHKKHCCFSIAIKQTFSFKEIAEKSFYVSQS